MTTSECPKAAVVSGVLPLIATRARRMTRTGPEPSALPFSGSLSLEQRPPGLEPPLRLLCSRLLGALGLRPGEPACPSLVDHLAWDFQLQLSDHRDTPLERFILAVDRLADALVPPDHQPPSIVDARLRGWLQAPHQGLPQPWAVTLRQWRLDLLAAAVADNVQLPQALVHGMTQCVLARDTWSAVLSRIATIDGSNQISAAGLSTAQCAFVQHLYSQRDRVDRHRASRWASLDALLTPPRTAAPTQARRLEAVAATVDLVQQVGQSNGSVSVLQKRLAGVQYASRARRAAIELGKDVLAAAQVRQLAAALAVHLHGVNKPAAAAALAVLLWSGTLTDLDGVCLGEAAGGIWLDSAGTAIVLDWAQVIQARGQRQPDPAYVVAAGSRIRIALPAALAHVITDLTRQFPGHASVGALLRAAGATEHHVNALMARCLASSARDLQSRAAGSYAGLLVELGVDELLSAIIALDFRICPVANFHYATVHEDAVHETCARVYSELRLGPPAPVDIRCVAGTHRQLQERHAARLVGRASRAAARVMRSLPRRCHIERLRRIHNVLCAAVLEMVAFFSCHRWPDRLVVPGHRSAFAQGAIVLSDKRQTDSHAWRIVPLPSVVVGWLECYVRWIGILLRRIDRPSWEHGVGGPLRTLSARLQAFDAPVVSDDAPMFFRLDERWVPHPCQPRRLLRLAVVSGLDQNLARHAMDAALRAEGVGTTAINAFMGRGASGQQAHETTSLAAQASTHEALRAALDRIAERWALAAPPRMASHRPVPAAGQVSREAVA